MGTNYYWHNPKPCVTCGHDSSPPRHIGKSSGGWVFSLHVYPDEGIKDLSDWRALWCRGEIKDEYGTSVSDSQMFDIVANRRGRDDAWDQSPLLYHGWDHFHRDNQSEQGPHNLLRARIDRCYAHGSGTWDCHTGDFS